MKRARPTPRRLGWSQSAQFRQIGRTAIRQWNAERDRLPRCEAVRKSDGGLCQQWQMANGRCYMHGGRTPRGDQWHVVQHRDCSTPKGEAKFNRKLRDQKRYAEKRAARLAAMTPEQLARHDAWHRSRAPGAAATRSADRLRRRQNAEARVLVSGEPRQRVSDPEAARVEAALAAAKAKLARLEARSAKPADEDEGIFA
jgi:hypothetical protein